MKWVFFMMVLLNAGFFVWRAYYAEPPVVESPGADQELPGQVNRLLLLSEFDAGKLRERDRHPVDPSGAAVAEQGAGGGTTPVEPAGACYSVGPLASPDDVERIGVWLRSRGGEAILRQGERREIATFWVYLPPFGSREQAVERVARMREDDIDDIYIIPRGDMANAVSLGLYSHRTSLERRLSELRSKGYEPSVAPRYTTQSASWFDVRFPGDFEFPSTRFAETFPATEARVVSCA
jgi:hypothetical protein